MSSEPHASEQDKDFVREALALHNVAVTQVETPEPKR